MDINGQDRNQLHQKLHRALASGDHQKAIEIFLDQHGMVHSGKMTKFRLWSFEISGLLLMPPTRHNFLHFNEALRIKQRMYASKKEGR